MADLIVETQSVTFPEPFVLRNGETLPTLTLAFETYGTLNEAKDNAVWICHALSGNAHCAGRYPNSSKVGWWDTLVGPGKALTGLVGRIDGSVRALSTDTVEGIQATCDALGF